VFCHYFVICALGFGFKMQDLRYIYSVARVRVLETHLLKKAIFLNILDARTLDAALRIIAETGSYSLDILNIKDTQGLETFINTERQKLERLALELFVDHSLFEAYLYLKNNLGKSYALIMQTNSDFLKDFMRKFIDLYNLKTILRIRYRKDSSESLKANLLEGGYIAKVELVNLFDKVLNGFYRQVIQDGIRQIEKDGNFSILERDIDDYLTHLLQPAKYMSFGPEAVFGYCLAKENELKRLRLLLLAKINNIAPALIQERLTLSYA